MYTYRYKTSSEVEKTWLPTEKESRVSPTVPAFLAMFSVGKTRNRAPT